MLVQARSPLPDPVPLVGGAFLRARPLVVGPMVLCAQVVLHLAKVPETQQFALGGLQAVMLTFFVVEALVARRKPVGERWLAGSLMITVVGIGLMVGVSGALESPLLAMLFAPLGVALGAFGRGRRSVLIVAVVLLVWLALLAVPGAWLFPPISAPWRHRMTLVCLFGAASLLWLGVAGLADAHRRALRSLHRTSEGILEEAAAKMRSLETVGARVAHEVKNPLASVKGLASLLAEGETEERRTKRFQVLRAEIERIEQILSDYLSFSRPLEALQQAPVALGDLVSELFDVLEARATRRGITLWREGAPLVVQVDRRRLFEALLNLCTNALEASPQRVDLCWCEGAQGVEIVVRDDGRGMCPETLARVGTPFFTSREGGTGLGVALARAVARQHGGELRFESAPGQGTVAVLEFPGEVVSRGDRAAGG